MRELAHYQLRGEIQIARLKRGPQIEQHGGFSVGQAGAEPALRAVQPLEEPAAQRGQLRQAGSPVAIVRLTVAEVFAVGGCGEGLDVFPVHWARLVPALQLERLLLRIGRDRKSTRLNSSHLGISYAVFCLK